MIEFLFGGGRKPAWYAVLVVPAFIALALVLVANGDASDAEPPAPTLVPLQTAASDVTTCPEPRLPTTGRPVTGSVGLRAGGHPACDNGGILAPNVFSLTDGATGQPIPGLPTLNASANGAEYSVSPDGRLLAISLARELLLIDLETWSQAGIVEFPGLPLAPLAWTPDGWTLFLTRGFGSRFLSGPALISDRRLWQLDLATVTLTRLPDLPFDSMLSPAVNVDGRLLYTLAFDRDDIDYHWAAKGTPFLSAVEVATGREVMRVPLPGLKVGADAELVTYEPAGVLDEARRRYYVAHAESDAITTVDIDTGVATTATASAPSDAGLPQRLLDGIVSVFVSGAEAKGEGHHERRAALGAEGRFLLVSGSDDTYSEAADAHDATSASTPGGLRVVDVETGKLVHFEPGIARFVLSADGRYVFGIGCAHRFEHEWAPEDCAGLKVLDLETMQLAAHIEPGRAYHDLALTLDGRYVHLIAEGPGRVQMRKEGVANCDSPCIQVVQDVVEVGTWRLANRIASETSFGVIGR